jgi:integrase/recombinase XerD
MLTIYRRHLKSCSHTSRSYRRCPCPIWVQGTLRGETIRRALDVTSIEAASNLVTHWNATAVIGAVKEELPRIEAAVAKYLDDARARHLAEATISKLTTIFEKQFPAWTRDTGLRYLKELTPERLTAWRSTWQDAALAASKKYQRAVGFFYFCMRMKWLSENPMKSLHPPKVKQDPTLPFTADEVNAIVSACDRFPLKGIYGEGNRNRLRAMTLLLRYSGLRIRDAATLRRERVQNGKLLLYMQKTGVPVFVPLPPYVVAALDETPNVHPNYFFWSGNGLPKTTVADWQRSAQIVQDRKRQRSPSASFSRHVRRRIVARRRCDRPSIHSPRSFIRESHGEKLCTVGESPPGPTRSSCGEDVAAELPVGQTCRLNHPDKGIPPSGALLADSGSQW